MYVFLNRFGSVILNGSFATRSSVYEWVIYAMWPRIIFPYIASEPLKVVRICRSFNDLCLMHLEVYFIRSAAHNKLPEFASLFTDLRGGLRADGATYFTTAAFICTMLWHCFYNCLKLFCNLFWLINRIKCCELTDWKVALLRPPLGNVETVR